MDCWHCRKTALGACRFCGRGVCEDHTETRPFVLSIYRGGPQTTPHVVAQQLLPAGSRRTLAAQLEPGRYRLRAVDVPGALPVVVSTGGAAEAEVQTLAAGWAAAEELALAEASTVHLENATAIDNRAAMGENRFRLFVAMAKVASVEGDLQGAINRLNRAEQVYQPIVPLFH